jgi:hypothetical protein
MKPSKCSGGEKQYSSAQEEIQWGREEIDEKGKTAGPKTLQIRYKYKCLCEIDTKKILRHWFEKVAKIDFFQSRGCKVIVLLR